MGQIRIKLDLDNLDNLSTSIRKRILKKAVRAGCRPVLLTLRATAPVDSGTLAKAMSTKVDSKKDDNVVYGLIGVRSSYTRNVKGRIKKPSKYAHLVNRKDHFLEQTANQLPRSIPIMQDIISQEVNAILAK